MTIKVPKFAITGLLAMGLAACGAEHNDNHQDGHKDGAHHETAHNEKPAVEPNHDEDHKDHNEHSTTIRQADSHVHGDAMLALALDGNTLVIELESPLYNLVGFERAPQSDTEKSRLSKAQSALTKSADLFAFNADARCKTDPRDAVALMADHDNDHAHEDEDHQDILLEYVFTCEAPYKLSSMTTTLFNHFPEMSELDTIYLGPATQIQSTLKPGKNTLKLTK